MSRGRRIALFVVILIVVLGVVFLVMQTMRGIEAKKSQASQKETAAIPVEVVSPTYGDIEKSIVRNGDVLSRTTIQVFPKAPGKIVSLPVSLGSKVGSGSTIAVIDRDEPGFEFTRLRVESPIYGEVAQVMVSVGQYVAPGTPLVSIIKPGDIKVVASFTEGDLAYIKQGQVVQVDIADSVTGTKSYSATINHIAPSANPANRSWPVELTMKEKPENLRAGAYVTVSVATEKHSNAMLLPRSAIGEKGGKLYSLVMQGDKAVKRLIKLGLTNETMVEIVEGLEPTDKVILIQGIDVGDGDKVQLVEAQKPAASATAK